MRILVFGACLLSAPAWADKPRAQVLCGVIANGKVETVVPTKDNRKLDKTISCAVHVEAGGVDHAGISLIMDGKEGMQHYDVVDVGTDFETTLDPDQEGGFPTCKDFTIVARIYKDKKAVWEQKVAVKQSCPKAGPKKAEPQGKKRGDGTDWDGGQRESLPDEDAAGQIDSWLQMYVFLDHTFFDSWPKDGVQIKGKTITAKTAQKAADAAGGLQLLTGIYAQANCKDEMKDPGKHPENCEFANWIAIVKSKTEVQIYSPGTSGYGIFATAVFKKKGDRWVWTAVGKYDTGEP
jgi:hypothetical protein